MPRIIAIMNQKGGVGKTTTTVNLGHALALEGNKVTLLGMDPQGKVAISLGVGDDSKGLDNILLHDALLDEHTIFARENLNIVPAGALLGDLEHIADGGSSRGHKLRLAIENSSLNRQDFILIDCPPSAGLLGINAMFAAEELIIPISGDYLSLQGLSRMMQILKRAESLSGHSIKLWLATTRMQARRRLIQEVRNKVLKYFPTRVLQTMIREDVALAGCPSFGKTIFDYRESSAGAEDYAALAQDILQRRTS